MKDLKIRFSGLPEGKHQYRFEIGDWFFESFEYGEISQGKVNTEVELDKQENMLLLNFTLEGYLRVICDRCGEEFDFPVSGTESLIVKFGDKKENDADEIIMITKDEHEIDISHFLYEFIILMLPYRKVHGEDENGNSLCDPEVISKIDEHQEDLEADPRWDALKKLKNNK